MTIWKTLIAVLSVAACGNALAQEFAMTCDEITTKLRREVTGAALERFKDLKGSCLGVVERDGNLYMTTKAIVRRASSRAVTLYLPATDRTFTINPKSDARVILGGRKVRPRELARGQELSIYVSVDAFTKPIIDSVALATESDEIIAHPATLAPALPTTG
jgi:hypothetical protein